MTIDGALWASIMSPELMVMVEVVSMAQVGTPTAPWNLAMPDAVNRNLVSTDRPACSD